MAPVTYSTCMYLALISFYGCKPTTNNIGRSHFQAKIQVYNVTKNNTNQACIFKIVKLVKTVLISLDIKMIVGCHASVIKTMVALTSLGTMDKYLLLDPC